MTLRSTTGSEERPASFPATERTKVRSKAMRAEYGRDAIYALIDEILYSTVSIVRDGRPHCQPMIHAREGDRLILHGSQKNALLEDIANGGEACISISSVDGIRMGRTIPNHSFDYRSVLIYGHAVEIHEIDEKLQALNAVFDHIVPGRWDSLPALDTGYLKFTRVLALPLEECVAKINSGPIEEDGPANPELWYGVVPIKPAAGEPRPGKENMAQTPSIDRPV